ncbi:helix-turn-helix transcriptional regulator [Nonomuraea sp. SYSU D8015]|uniref:helix-turn-helix transcriptional regulator n=1 Tax=Nonomuraea sp. SYSU D8015 TaxID=2593644 RepID=UPI0016602195|nr:helix-turn-helix transcriptional regulator [Nonomuraea sp. SYSU D8015]
MIIDFAGPPGLVSGPRSTHGLYQQAGWRHGVAIGLTPAGVSGLLGLPMPYLAGGTALLDDLLGRRAAELAERLGESPDWATRFAVLDERLSAWLAPDERLDKRVMYAWSRLQNPADRITIQGLAGELGISRRHLETGFRRHIGLPPKTVARIARFQHALGELSSPSASLAMAATYGYADQSHFSREVRAMSGMTPSALFAFVQDANQVTG